MKHAVKSILQDLENKNVENRGKLKKKKNKKITPALKTCYFSNYRS